MNRIMKPKAVAVIGASIRGRPKDRQLGDEEPDQRRLQRGQIYPINPSADEIMGLKAVQERQGRSRRPSNVRGMFAISGPSSSREPIAECGGRKKIPGGRAHSVGICRKSANVAGQQEIVDVGPQVRRPP